MHSLLRGQINYKKFTNFPPFPMYIPTAMLLDCIFQTWHWCWLSQRRGWTSKIDSIQLKMYPKRRHLSYHSNCTDCLPWAKEDLWFHKSKNNLHSNIIYERLIAVFDWMFLEGLCQGCVAQFVIITNYVSSSRQ